MKDKKNYTVFSHEDITVTGQVRADVLPRTDTTVTPSGMTQVTQPGYKCAHGSYIPATAKSPNHAPYCSNCYPYLIKAK
jgi:hypothetical protein